MNAPQASIKEVGIGGAGGGVARAFDAGRRGETIFLCVVLVGWRGVRGLLDDGMEGMVSGVGRGETADARSGGDTVRVEIR